MERANYWQRFQALIHFVGVNESVSEEKNLKRERRMKRTKRPSILPIRYRLQEKTPRRLEHKITKDRSNAFEFWGQRILGTRFVWRTLSDILGVQRKQLVNLGVLCVGKEDFFQVSA